MLSAVIVDNTSSSPEVQNSPQNFKGRISLRLIFANSSYNAKPKLVWAQCLQLPMAQQFEIRIKGNISILDFFLYSPQTMPFLEETAIILTSSSLPCQYVDPTASSSAVISGSRSNVLQNKNITLATSREKCNCNLQSLLPLYKKTDA